MLKQKQYNLVFYGKIANDRDLAVVKRKLAASFKMPPRTIEQMFTGEAVTIKAKVDYKAALKTQIVLEWMGLLCQIEPISPDLEEEPDEAPGNHVNLIFDGQIAEHYDMVKVKSNLRRLLKLPAKRVDDLFTGHPVILMQDVDYHPALKIQISFELAGARCRLEPATPPPVQEIVTTASALKRHDALKVKQARQLARKMQAAMQQELLYWGIGLVILGIVQFASLGFWSAGIVSIGLVNLLARRRILFLVNGMAVCVSGTVSFVNMTLQTLFANGISVVSAGNDSIEYFMTLGGILLLNGAQIYLGGVALKAFKKYAPRFPHNP